MATKRSNDDVPQKRRDWKKLFHELWEAAASASGEFTAAEIAEDANRSLEANDRAPRMSPAKIHHFRSIAGEGSPGRVPRPAEVTALWDALVNRGVPSEDPLKHKFFDLLGCAPQWEPSDGLAGGRTARTPSGRSEFEEHAIDVYTSLKPGDVHFFVSLQSDPVYLEGTVSGLAPEVVKLASDGTRFVVVRPSTDALKNLSRYQLKDLPHPEDVSKALDALKNNASSDWLSPDKDLAEALANFILIRCDSDFPFLTPHGRHVLVYRDNKDDDTQRFPVFEAHEYVPQKESRDAEPPELDTETQRDLREALRIVFLAELANTTSDTPDHERLRRLETVLQA